MTGDDRGLPGMTGGEDPRLLNPDLMPQNMLPWMKSHSEMSN